MITIDQKIFERVASSATNADNQVFDKIEPHLQWAEEQLRVELLSDDADKFLESVPNLAAVVTRLICLRAYYEQIPHLDLVLTATGFGIVSNNNLAPASADRVKSLREQVKHAYEDDYDKAIELLIGTEWADTTQAIINIPNMIYTARVFRSVTDKPNAHRSDLESAHIAIYKAEEKVREHISSELYDSLLNKVRHYNQSKTDTGLISMICRFIGFCIAKEWVPAKSLLTKIEDFVENHADAFMEYKNSSAYKVKHFGYYKNEKEDTTYFFG